MGNITRPPEAVVDAAFFVAHCEARIQQVPFFKAFLGHGTDEAVPTVWSKTQAEPGHGAPGQAPVLKVLEPPLPHRL